MFKLSTRFSHHHHHTLRRTVPPATRIFSTTHGAAQSKTPQSKSETDSERKIPSKDDVNPKSMESTRSGTHDEVAHTNKAAYGPNTNPTEEKAIADAEEKTERPGSPLEYSAANPDVSYQGEDKSSCVGGRERSKASGGSKRA